jgi:hypothetical protein
MDFCIVSLLWTDSYCYICYGLTCIVVTCICYGLIRIVVTYFYYGLIRVVVTFVMDCFVLLHLFWTVSCCYICCGLFCVVTFVVDCFVLHLL